MDWKDRRRKFRQVIGSERCIRPGSVHDALSARIAEDLGFEAGMLGGSVASLAVLGAPDVMVLTLSELAGLVQRINRAGNLPLMIDADHGFGNGLNVRRTVEELETAGAAGLSIEDTDLPEPYGSGGKTRILSIEEGVGKMRAALAGRQDPDLVIAGRTSAASVNGLDDAIARAKAYEAAGVDAIFLIGLKTRAELDAASEAVGLPLIIGGVPPELNDWDYLSARRVRIALQGHQPISAAIAAVEKTLRALKEGAHPSEIDGLAAPDLIRRVTRADDYEALAERTLGRSD
ncbi:isocitrate lyase/PEP mutase family protein [Nisaea acidiphila]|uniref:Isocitrate lyase/PEP mutase family protein n=1 Tax=Nisaea acidiphila TaxID=1862145 RepID=A0A9J7ALT4_9PROT|nr:isocitrate lyase/PEP mutase family protein [Nisaea acidiphila]UUX48118.1 isocitrate lyase/PEP mutase family protein [Nisaea acidiphila]